jgi:phosphoribosylpyrophosphate synthetase
MPSLQTLINEISALPQDQLNEVYVFITHLVQTQATDNNLEKIRQKRLSVKGCMKGKVRIADDFDAPLEDFREYME